MLIPLYVLAAGALLSGFVAYGWFVGEGWEHFWGTSIAVKATEHVLHHMHEVPTWVKLLPLVAALSGLGAQLLLLHRQSSTAGAGPCGRSSRCTPLFYNKWYFDELYDAVFVQPAPADRPRLLEEGRRRHDRRAGSGRHRGPRVGPRRRAEPLPERLPLPLRLRDADRRGRPRHLLHAVRRGRHDGELAAPFPRHLPAAGGCGFCLVVNGAEGGRRPQLPQRRADHLAGDLPVSLLLWIALRPDQGRLPVRGEARPGCRRSTSATTWASTASRCSSCCCRPC